MSKEIATQRRFWNNEADAFQRIYTHKKSTFANFLDRLFRKDMYERFKFTIESCKPIRNRTFLDVGCGNGLYSLELARRGAAQVVGIDISEVMIELCRESSGKEKLDGRCSFSQTDLLAYSPQSPFDVSFAIGLFDYISDPLPVLTSMRKVTRDRAIIAFPRFWTWRAPLRKLRLRIKGCEVFFYRKSRIRKLLQQAGFRRHDITKVGKLYCVVAYPE